jgi:DNA repair protein RecO (recombination protein O)
MSNSRRVQQQPAYILHRRPFRDSSQIIDVITRDFGAVALVARASRGSKSRLAGLLRPFMPLRVSWVAKSDLGTLTGAEANGRPLGLKGDALMSAYYVNELLLYFLHRHDPQPEIFELYSQTIPSLCSDADIASCLRNFELELLSLLGYAVNLGHEAGTGDKIDPAGNYEYRIDQGPVPVARSDGPLVFRGAMLLAIAAREFDDPEVLRSANRLLRAAVTHHLGGKELQSRKVLRELHRGRIAPSQDRKPLDE